MLTASPRAFEAERSEAEHQPYDLPRPSQRPGYSARTTQRKPRWHVEVSTGWDMRAAGR